MSVPKIFISYAHEDIDFLKALVKRLKPLKRTKKIELWHDGELKPGEKWDESVKGHLAAADIIIILLSVDFIDSDYIFDEELPRIIERREKKEIQLIPIMARGVTLEGTGIGKYQCLPQDDARNLKPLIEWDKQELDKVWVAIDKQIRKVIDSVKQKGSDNFSQPKKDDENYTNLSVSVTPTPSKPIEPMTFGDFKKDLIKSMVLDLGKALDKLDSRISTDSSQYNMLIQLQSRYNTNKKREMNGTARLDSIDIENAKIRQSVQFILEELTEEDLS